MNGVFNDRLSDKERKGSLLTYQLPQTSRRWDAPWQLWCISGAARDGTSQLL